MGLADCLEVSGTVYNCIFSFNCSMSNVVFVHYQAVKPECRPNLLCRYVDDLLLLFPNQDSLHRFFASINSVHGSIVFTKELETNNCLHFLDVLIEKSSTSFITSTYRKPTHTCLYSKWSSFFSVVQETKPCQLFTPLRLWHCQFLRTGAHGIYEY